MREARFGRLRDSGGGRRREPGVYKTLIL